VKSIVFVVPPVDVVPDVDVLDGVSLDVLVDASVLVPFFDFSFFVVVAFEALVSAFAVPVVDFASFTDAFVLALFALLPLATLPPGFVVLTFVTDAFGAGLFVAPPFGAWVLLIVGLLDGFEGGFAASVTEAANATASATRIVSRRMDTPSKKRMKRQRACRS
jgi:hypothetical protein